MTTSTNSLFDSIQRNEYYQKLQSTFLSNPLNLLLLLILLYIAIPIFLPQSPNSSTLTPTLSQARSESNPSRYSALPKNHPESIVWKKYSPRTLAVHDGSALNPDSTKGKAKGNGIEGDEEPGSKILLAILGKVFDVTKGANFYGPGGPYGNFAGRDASRGMAKQSFDAEMLTPLDQPIDKLEDLTPMEITNMRDWSGHFTGKYGIVGELVNEGEQD